VELSGDLDLEGVAAVRGAVLDGVLAADRPVVLDLSALGHLSSSGMGLLLEVVRTSGEQARPVMVVLPPDGAARRALDLTGLSAVLRAAG